MATRLYLQSTGAAPFNPTVSDGGWEQDSAAYVSRNMRTTKQNTALTTLSAAFGTTATGQTRYATFVSDTLDVAQTISGTVSLVIGKCAETSTSGDAHLAFTLRVVSGSGVHKATLASVMTTSTEFALIASAATRIHSAIAISSFAASAGDRLVLEIGIHGVTPANEVMQMRIGDPSATSDFALTAALTTDLVPWAELSQNVTFGTPASNPSISSASMVDAGRNWTTGEQDISITFSVAMSGAPAVGATIPGLTVDADAGLSSESGIVTKYVSGNGTTTWVVRVDPATTLTQAHTVVIDYSRASGSIVATSGGTELEDTSNKSVTNSLTKRIRESFKYANGGTAALANITVSVHVQSTMALDVAIQTTATDVNGLLDMQYTGSSAPGDSVYLAIRFDDIVPTETALALVQVR